MRPAPLAGLLLHLAVRAGSSGALPSFEEARAQAASLRGEIVAWRRALHQQPELMYQEHNTSKLVQEALAGMGVPFIAGWGRNTHQDRIPGPGGTGVVAELGTGAPPIVALRADMDALPILEETPVAFRSRNEGRMHACGHDGHTSMLLGAAKLLQASAKTLPGTVRLIFQPAEEGGAGAKRMLEEGALEGVSRVFGLHVWPGLPSGSIGGRAGVILAAGDFFELQIVGRGAHGAMPHQGVDPVAAAAAVVQSLQTIVSRETDPLEAAVVSVTKLQAGHAFNVIPGSAVVGGTVRSVTAAGLLHLRQRVVEVATGVAGAHRCSVENMTFMPDYFPPTHNDHDLWRWLASPEAGIKGAAAAPPMHWDMPLTMGSEDFSFFTQEVPGAFILLGQGTGGEDPPTNVSLHNPRYHMDESVLELGAALHAQLALRSLRALGASPRGEL